MWQFEKICDRISANPGNPKGIRWIRNSENSPCMGIQKKTIPNSIWIPTSWFYLFWTKTGLKLIRPNVQENGPRNEVCNSCRSFHVKFLMFNYSGFQRISLCSARKLKTLPAGRQYLRCTKKGRRVSFFFEASIPVCTVRTLPSASNFASLHVTYEKSTLGRLYGVWMGFRPQSSISQSTVSAFYVTEVLFVW